MMSPTKINRNPSHSILPRNSAPKPQHSRKNPMDGLYLICVVSLAIASGHSAWSLSQSLASNVSPHIVE